MQKGSLFFGESSRISCTRLLGICFLSLVAAGTGDKCPFQITPRSVVVKYGDPVSVNCSTSITHKGMGWESTVGVVPLSTASLITWRVPQLTDWDIQPPYCYINYVKQCEVDLPVTIYKTPDSVIIRVVSQTMKEGNQYELLCDVHNVAPVQNLTVNWYKGETLVDQTNFNDTTKKPVNKTSILLISPDRADDGAQYRCEAVLNLGEEGPQPSPKNTSEPLRITVNFKPTINEDELPSIVSVVRGYSEVVVCKAEGKPKPTISWSYGTFNGETFTITDSTPENLTCTATNAVGSSSRSVKVVIQDISIRTVNHTGPMIEGNQYVLQCDVHNVQSLTVNWYKGDTLVDQTNFTDTTKSPVNKTFYLLIHPDRHDDGAQYKCEAELKPSVTSNTLNITVNFKPVINETILPSVVPVFRGYPVDLSCIAEGKPKPIISWKHKNEIIYSEYLTVTESTPEKLVCIANNSVEVVFREVKVVLKEDYLPLIAGLIAITVAFISVIFIFIYTIYYKTAKMGRYSLKDAKPSAQNGNIAQNGKDNTIPMKKLSQSNILA